MLTRFVPFLFPLLLAFRPFFLSSAVSSTLSPPSLVGGRGAKERGDSRGPKINEGERRSTSSSLHFVSVRSFVRSLHQLSLLPTHIGAVPLFGRPVTIC